jgi:hypothetical protein
MKQGPFARTGLCCPGRRHYYDPLRLPLDRSPLPGITGYRQACFPHPQTGAEEALSSSQDNLLTVPRPIRRRVLEHPLQDPKCCPWPSPSKCRLGSPLARSREVSLTTPQASLHVADRPVATPSTGCSCSASTPDSHPMPGAALPRTLASPRTGLTPAGCPELVTRLRHDTSSMTWRPSCWTHTLT